MHGEYIALLGLAGSLLMTLIVSTWKFSSVTARLVATIDRLERETTELESRAKALDELPALKKTIEHLQAAVSDLSKTNHALNIEVVKLQSRMKTLEERYGSIKMAQNPWRRSGSRPDPEEEGGDG